MWCNKVARRPSEKERVNTGVWGGTLDKSGIVKKKQTNRKDREGSVEESKVNRNT